MRYAGFSVAVLVVGLGLVLAGTTARADEETVPVDKLPKAVVAAVNAKFPSCKIKEAAKEDENGKTIYEVSITHEGHAIDVSLNPDGTIVTVETEIKADALPGAVSRAINAKYPKAPIKKAEEIKKGETLTYEVLLEKAAGKYVEVVLDPAGKILEEEDKGGKKD